MEILQENGFVVKKEKLKMAGVNSAPSENHQNVTIRYVYNADENEEFNLNDTVGGEKDDVEDVQWMDITDNKSKLLDDGTKWAFNHNILIKKHS